VFGLTGWGCRVTRENIGLVIIPQDGLFRRIHLIDRKLSIISETHKITRAVISENSILLDLTSVPGSPSSAVLTLSGLRHKTYQIITEGKPCGSFEGNERIPVKISCPTEAESCRIEIAAVCCDSSSNGCGE